MKNLTIKKVALGLFLAGYAASSAFALTAVTNATIQGNAPVMKAPGGTDAHRTAVTIKHADGSDIAAGEPVMVGDVIHISYVLEDADGDTDDGDALKDTLKVYARQDASSPWDEMTINATIAHGSDGNATISFPITNDFAGKSKIGFKVLERTDFGAPSIGKWVHVGDIFSSNGSGSSDDDPGTPGDNTGPGVPPPGITPGPIVPAQYQTGIFLIDTNGVIQSSNYASNGLNPKYGERYAAVVWNDANSDNNVDAGEAEYTGSYKFEWHVVGAGIPENDNVPAESTALTADTNNRKGINDTIWLGSPQGAAKHNSIYSSFSTHKAGIQGYQLSFKTVTTP
ncbi:hypothetical protein [Gilliamella sp. ESL0250]|uniref:hypothetical protein n=1 Tax=Gilliamella sp. ESL0250 TaxID=2705036 RepID=UPI001580EBDD|nr:hypothetical protein [Gilliamella sp. ESL0250]NUF49275.1 hypothetical protein [Gilliamella sp. ESL0250]